MQLIAYVSLTLASVVIASVSLFLGYRQNFGWKPIVLVVGSGLKGSPDYPEHYAMTLSLEVWNRHKYPIVVRGLDATFSELRFEEGLKNYDYPAGFYLAGSLGRISSHNHTRLDPSSYLSIELEAPFLKRSLDNLDDEIVINVRWFDPRTNKHKKIKTTERYKFK